MHLGIADKKNIASTVNANQIRIADVYWHRWQNDAQKFFCQPYWLGVNSKLYDIRKQIWKDEAEEIYISIIDSSGWIEMVSDEKYGK